MVDRDLLDVLALGRAEFERRLVAVGPDDWERTTPCTEWNVRQLVNHVVGQEFRTSALLDGGPLAEFIRSREDDFLGSDPLAAWTRGCARLDAVVWQPGALERIVEYRTGPTTGNELLAVRTFDMVVHTWDLAQGIGSLSELEPRLLSWAIDAVAGPLDFLWGRLAEAMGPLPTDASPQERLLHMTGRSAHAS